jgi:hypothetical protein
MTRFKICDTKKATAPIGKNFGLSKIASNKIKTSPSDAKMKAIYTNGSFGAITINRIETNDRKNGLSILLHFSLCIKAAIEIRTNKIK